MQIQNQAIERTFHYLSLQLTGYFNFPGYSKFKTVYDHLMPGGNKKVTHT